MWGSCVSVGVQGGGGPVWDSCVSVGVRGGGGPVWGSCVRVGVWGGGGPVWEAQLCERGGAGCRRPSVGQLCPFHPTPPPQQATVVFAGCLGKNRGIL